MIIMATMGRPTKYTGNTCKRARHYLANHLEYDDLVPSIAGLACALDVTRETVREWASEEGKEDFSAIVGKIMASQEKKLLNGGLSGGHNASIAKLMLSKHGYSDKSEVQQTGDSTLSITVVSE